MEVFLNGKTPPFFESDVPDLNEKKIQYAVNNMHYVGLQMCAAGYLLIMTKMGHSPKEIKQMLEEAINDKSTNQNHQQIG